MANFLSPFQVMVPVRETVTWRRCCPGSPLPEEANEELRGVCELLATLRSAPMDRVERRGQAEALGAFREKFADFRPTRHKRRRTVMISTLLGAKLGAALAAGAVSFGAVGAAAYTGVLPDGAQQLAHTAIGAPAPGQGENADASKDATDAANDAAEATKEAADAAKDPAEAVTSDAADPTKSTPVGPDATGPAAFGLCTAWGHVQTEGQVADKSVAFRNLATAAGGADKITAYCATVLRPGSSLTGKPATHPGDKSATHPTGKSSSHPTGKPTTHPGGNPGVRK
jgi:hypothetical protein